MKIFTLLLSAILFACTTNGQADFHFAGSTAQWNVLSIGDAAGPPIYYITDIFRVMKDTVINSYGYQIIEDTTNKVRAFIRRDSLSRIFVLHDADTAGFSSLNQANYLAYDFAKVVGDTFTIRYTYWGGTVIVDSVDSVTIGSLRKRMVLCLIIGGSPDCGNGPYKLTCIDGIGLINGNFLAPEGNFLIGGGASETLCYYENSTLLYHDNTYPSCNYDTITSIGNNLPANRNIKVFPNPVFDNIITVQAEDGIPQFAVFHLYDLTGRELLQEQLSSVTSHFETGNIQGGIYMYSVTSQQQKIGTGKLVIE